MKLFRRIRNTLLNEGKTSKYLKYAIGEIILVVIGILIAIQANNWNIGKVAQKEKEFALQKLIANINLDIREFKAGIEEGEGFISSLDSCLIILKNPNAYSKDYFSELFSNMNYTLPFEFNQITFNEISSSGKLKLIKNEKLTDSLLLYYNEGNYKAVSDALNFFTRDNIRSYTMGYDYLLLHPVVNQYKASEFSIKAKSLMDYSSDVQIINSIRFKILLLNMLINRYNELIDKAENLIVLINEELDST